VAEAHAALKLQIDFGGGVAAKATQSDAARDFLAYLVSPEAQALWKANGVAVPIP
jgi:ABC-type glycerol-3-phosphate transport system substrate-binding protein